MSHHQQTHAPAAAPGYTGAPGYGGAPSYGHAPGYGGVPGHGGAPGYAAAYGASPSSALHWVVPVGRSWQSVTAGYVALFAIFIWPLGPLALGLGVWAFVRASRHAGHGRGRATFAVIVGLLTSLLLLVILREYVLTGA